jgi:hypothetical protein
MLDLGLFSLTQLLIFNVTTKTLNPCLMLYMTKTEYEKLELRRDYISFFGFTLIMLNLLIGLAVIIGSIITGESLITHPVSLVSVLVIAILTGVFALVNLVIGQRLKKARIRV